MELHYFFCKRILILSDTGFFELQKHGEGFLVPPTPPPTFPLLHPDFCSRAVVMFNLVSNFTNRSKVHKIIQNYESIQASRFMTS